MDRSTCNGTIRVKSKYVNYLRCLSGLNTVLSTIRFHTAEEYAKDEDFVCFQVGLEEVSDRSISDLQNYVNSLCDELETEEKSSSSSSSLLLEKLGTAGGTTYSSSVTGEDSSYDSDYEGSEEQTHGHDDVSRTVSDTLGQEFSEYVFSAPPAAAQNNQSQQQQLDSAGAAYQSRVEFALKLGYTEKLVQAALQKLGPNPEQNELLAELIKLGAQHQLNARLKNDTDSYDNIDEFAEQVTKFRPIVIDGSNVAMSHGNKEVFSCRGIKICVDWFRARGHAEITVFVPKWRKETPRPDNPVIDQEILHELEKERLLVFTPSREIRGKRMVCYDDRYILKLATENDGIVVSNDNYRDLVQECPEFRKVVEERILMYSFVNDRFMPPDDPLGRSGPTLDNFLKMSTHRKGETCPYGKKCTYGNKCKYSHPERGLGPQKSITERLVENAQKQLLARSQDSYTGKKLKGKSLSLPLQSSESTEDTTQLQPGSVQLPNARKQALSRTKSTTFNCKSDLSDLSKGMVAYTESSSDSCFLRNTCTSSATAASHQANASLYNYRMIYPFNSIPSPSQSESQSFPLHPNSAGSRTVEHDSSVNLHRKLQRQLSINPTCDPRIYQMQRQFTSPEAPQPHHVPASRHYSYQDPNFLSAAHSNVTRISSAPPANPAYTVSSDCTQSSNSEPQLNLSAVAGGFSPVSSGSGWSLQAPTSQTYSVISSNVEESRRKLHYHLASIFPEEQVNAAMRYYPNETNPQKICAAILSMFPKP